MTHPQNGIHISCSHSYTFPTSRETFQFLSQSSLSTHAQKSQQNDKFWTGAATKHNISTADCDVQTYNRTDTRQTEILLTVQQTWIFQPAYATTNDRGWTRDIKARDRDETFTCRDQHVGLTSRDVCKSRDITETLKWIKKVKRRR